MKKKIVLYILSCFCLFTSCDVETNEEPGGTSIEKNGWNMDCHF